MISRRSFLQLAGGGALASLALSSYAFAIEPRFRLEVTRYRLRPRRFAALARPLRIAAVADLHACDPWMPLSRVEEIVDVTNRLKPDLIVLLGDFMAGMERFRLEAVPAPEWGAILGQLRAPLGVRAILGNHDWWTDVKAARSALLKNGIAVMENDVELVRPEGGPSFWLAGLGDQLAHRLGHRRFKGVDDLPGTLANVTDEDRPVILLAHEPDIFPLVPPRVDLTLSGHTHGGQVYLPMIGRPVVPSAYGQRYAYGHVVEDDRHLIVSGGLGCSGIPVRFGDPPEIVVVELG
jgi:predicted MPP superfamily phosphohydrolase